MRILHILGKNITIGTEAAFLDMVTAFCACAPDIQQSAIIPHNRYLAASLERIKVPYDREKFDGLLDFKTPRNIQKITKSQNFDIVLAHSNDATVVIPNTLKIKNFIGDDKRQKQNLPPLTYIQHSQEPIERFEAQTPANATIVGTMTWLTADKKLGTLIQAAAELPDVHLWIAGEGPHLPALQKLSDKLGLHGRVHFLGRQVNRSAFLKSLDICFVPLRKKGCDRLTLEAWASEIPVISALSEKSAYGTHMESVRLVNADSPIDCRDSIRQLIEDEMLRARLKNNGLQEYMRDYTPEKLIPRYLELFKQYES